MSKIIVLRFPEMGGKHFIANCLALHPRILHMDYNHAKNKIKGNLTPLGNFAVSMMPALKTMEMNLQFEYNTFNGADLKHQQLWPAILSQNYYSPVFEDNPNIKLDKLDQVHIRSVNNKWLMDRRNQKNLSKKKIKGVDTIDFNMGTILDAEQFCKEITKVTDYLQFDPIDQEQIKMLLSVWIKGVDIVCRGYGNRVIQFDKKTLQKKIKIDSSTDNI